MVKTCFQHEAQGPRERLVEDTLDLEPPALSALDQPAFGLPLEDDEESLILAARTPHTRVREA